MTKRLQRFANVFVIALLRSRLHRLASGSLLLITYRGRRSGRRYTIPVMYAEQDGTLTIFVGHAEQKTWWRSIGEVASVEIRLRGRELAGQATVVHDTASAERYARRFPRARSLIEDANRPTFVRIEAIEPNAARPPNHKRERQE